MSIIVKKFVIDDAVLDLIGKQFKFDHAKGISEWFKNSTDAYIRKNVPNKDQLIIIRLFFNKPSRINKIDVIDFIGMTKEEIDNAFIRFFDPNAAKYGADKIDIKTMGGHGNGGKFYMRQMFKTSRIFTYKNGNMNIFGFDEQKNYGYESGFENKKMSLQDALNMTSLLDLQVPSMFWDKLKSGKIGFTVVRGNYPIKASSTEQLKILNDKLLKNAQARRLMERKPIYLVLNDEKNLLPLKVKKLTPKKSFEEPISIKIPSKIELGMELVDFSKYGLKDIGELKLFTSEEPLIGNNSELNTIDFIGDLGVIATYKIHEMGKFGFSNQLEFIYGECIVPILEKDEYDSISNDRQKFINNKYSESILNFVREKTDILAEKMEIESKKQRKIKKLSSTSLFNEILNRWKNRFMDKIISEMKAGEGPVGISGNELGGGIGRGGSGVTTISSNPKSRSIGDSGGSITKKQSRFPKVLVSGKDIDPFDSKSIEPFNCDQRHPAVYQRKIDEENGIYWINTSKPLAEKIIEKFTDESSKWRDYLFQRYIDIIIKETLKQLGKTNPSFSIDDINLHLDKTISDILDLAYKDLMEFLLDEKYST